VSDIQIVGKIGSIFAQYSQEYIGYLSYIYLIVFLYPIYKYNFSYIDKKFEKFVISIFLFLTFIIFQSLVLEGSLSGKIGNIIIDELSPFIGIAGLWLFVLVGFIVCFYILIQDFSNSINKIIKNIILSFNLKSKINKKIKEPKKPIRQKISVKEVGDTAEIIIEDVVEQIEPSITNEKTVIKNTVSSIIVEELEENKKLLEDIDRGIVDKPKNFKLPSTSFFTKTPKYIKNKINESVIDKKIKDLLEKLAMFKIDGDVVRTYSGPVVTTFEFNQHLM
jgi:S-DNA-T family DNA segregation ATPase FtsK/SpoIIIE